MNPRTTQILEAVLREYIETGEPVSSKGLSRRHDFGVRDATIRNELKTLIVGGFLAQVHISSGRVPTDKAYRFLAEKVIREFLEDGDLPQAKSVNYLCREFSRRAFGDLVNDLSQELELLGVGYEPREEEIYKSGLQELFGRLVGDSGIYDPAETFLIVKDFEMMDERMDDLLNFMSKDSRPKVFIGKSPITRSRELSVIADRYGVNGDEFVLAAVGPKRMDYERNIGVFMKLREVIGE